MSIIANTVKKLNVYFKADEGEEIPVSDFLWFYGIFGSMLLMAIVFIILNIIS